jgi:hypothetical protein
MPGQFRKCSRFRLPDINDQIATQQPTPFEQEKRNPKSGRVIVLGFNYVTPSDATF